MITQHIRYDLIGCNPLLQDTVLSHQADPLKGSPQRQDQVGPLQRLLQVVEGPLFHGLNSRIHCSVGGHEDHALLRVVAKNLFQQIQSALPLHLQIGQNQVEFPFIQLIQRLAHARDINHVIAFLGKNDREDFPLPPFIIHDQDAAVFFRIVHDPFKPLQPCHNIDSWQRLTLYQL